MSKDGLLDRPLYSDEVLALLGSNCYFTTYDKLSSIRSLLPLPNRILLLYLDSKQSGHYVCLVKDPKTAIIYFYDSFGLSPDNQFKYVNKKYNYTKSPHLCRLLIDAIRAGWTIDYNNHVMQDDAASTCGRHCALRMLFDDLSNDEYFAMYKEQNPKKLDELVIRLTTL